MKSALRDTSRFAQFPLKSNLNLSQSKKTQKGQDMLANHDIPSRRFTSSTPRMIALGFLAIAALAGCGGGGSGSSDSPAPQMRPGTLTFGSQFVGSASTAQTVTVSNSGTGSLSISAISITGANAGGFSQTNTCGAPLLAGGSCAVSVTFTPSASGPFSAAVSFTTN